MRHTTELGQLASLLEQSVTRVFDEAAFLEIAIRDDVPEWTGDVIRARISLTGPVEGWLDLLTMPACAVLIAANLIGAGAAAIWNFSLNHAITWRE